MFAKSDVEFYKCDGGWGKIAHHCTSNYTIVSGNGALLPRDNNPLQPCAIAVRE